MSRAIFRLFIGVLGLVLVPSANAATFYVDGVAGSDARTCSQASSWASAKKTITSALACLSATGDVVEVSGGASGVTYNEVVDISSKNGGANYFTLRGSSQAGHDGVVTITNSASNAAIFIHGPSSYVRIDNLTVNAVPANLRAVSVYGGDHIEISRVTVTGDSQGYNVDQNEYGAIACYNATDCWIHHNRVVGGSYDTGIEVNADTKITRNHVIEHNTVTSFGYCGIKSRKSNYSIIRYNDVAGPENPQEGDTKIFLLRETNFNVVENNVGRWVRGTTGSPSYQHYVEIRGMTTCGAQGNTQSNNNVVQNNTFAKEYAGPWTSTYAAAVWFADDSSGNVFRNNIVDGNFDTADHTFTGCWDRSCPRVDNDFNHNLVTGPVAHWYDCSSFTPESNCCYEKSGALFSDNVVSTSAKWQQSGEKPYPYYWKTSKDSGASTLANGFPSPDGDFVLKRRGVPPDIGAFESLRTPQNLKAAP